MADYPEIDIVGMAEKIDALLLAVMSLENRVSAIERATPLKAPRTKGRGRA